MRPSSTSSPTPLCETVSNDWRYDSTVVELPSDMRWPERLPQKTRIGARRWGFQQHAKRLLPCGYITRATDTNVDATHPKRQLPSSRSGCWAVVCTCYRRLFGLVRSTTVVRGCRFAVLGLT